MLIKTLENTNITNKSFYLNSKFQDYFYRIVDCFCIDSLCLKKPKEGIDKINPRNNLFIQSESLEKEKKKYENVRAL